MVRVSRYIANVVIEFPQIVEASVKISELTWGKTLGEVKNSDYLPGLLPFVKELVPNGTEVEVEVEIEAENEEEARQGVYDLNYCLELNLYGEFDSEGDGNLVLYGKVKEVKEIKEL